jgi:MtN3 and saliva related transmembrane protein
MIELIGWMASFVLLITIITQIREQWKTETNEGVSKWLFVGQLTASIGFMTYSILSANAVFAVTNGFLTLGNLVGIYIYYRNSVADN